MLWQQYVKICVSKMIMVSICIYYYKPIIIIIIIIILIIARLIIQFYSMKSINSHFVLVWNFVFSKEVKKWFYEELIWHFIFTWISSQRLTIFLVNIFKNPQNRILFLNDVLKASVIFTTVTDEKLIFCFLVLWSILQILLSLNFISRLC